MKSHIWKYEGVWMQSWHIYVSVLYFDYMICIFRFIFSEK